jgi:Rieske Fe-S protein
MVAAPERGSSSARFAAKWEQTMVETEDKEPPNDGAAVWSRRSVLLTLGVALDALAALLVAIPVVGYLLQPQKRGGSQAWIRLAPVDSFPEGETRMASYVNPFTVPWDGDTATIPCWVRRTSGERFQVFAINCTHLGCPVRWFQESGLFLCPCHGGAYYEDGSRASGPPPRGLYEYEYRVEDGHLWIRGGRLPTLQESV